MSDNFSQLVSWINDNQKALIVSVAFGCGWTLIVKYWKQKLAKNMGFVGTSELKDEYDYVIIGAGTAGSLLASRLSEDEKCSVLLIEAGSPVLEDFGVRSPALWTSLWYSPNEWAFFTTKQSNLNSRTLNIHRARVLGGNSVNDNLTFSRGVKQNYQNWVDEHGVKGWDYATLLPFFKKTESFRGIGSTNDQRGKGGEIVVENISPSSIGSCFVEASNQIGLPTLDLFDYNNERQHGACLAQTTTDGGLRSDAARSFLFPIFQSRKNLTIKSNTFVTKVLVNEEKVANGVNFVSPEDAGTVAARKEIIVCGGPLNTPALLMLSGIGPKEHLEEKEIECIVDLPVGENLQDQVVVPLSFRTQKSEQSSDTNLYSFSKFIIGLFQYYFQSKGFLYHPFVEAVALECAEEEKEPSLQYLATTRNFKDCHVGYSETEEMEAPHPGICLMPVLLNPKSVGNVKLQNNDPFMWPETNPNFFDNEDDRLTLAHGAMRCYEMAKAEAFAPVIRDFIISSPLEDGEEKSLEYWTEYVTENAQCANHQIGTCRMGSDPKTSVVDNELRVHGIKNLRVIDSSVIPQHVSSSNPRAVTAVLAERGAMLLKESYYPSTIKTIN